MDLLLNFGFAWISIFLTFALTIIYLLRLYLKNQKTKNTLILSCNKILRKHHKQLGFLLVVTGLIHGLASSSAVFSFNMGTICWIVSILLGLNFMFRKQLSRLKGWMIIHRGLTVIFLLTILIHIVDVGGIQVFSLLEDLKSSSTIPLSNEISGSLIDTVETNTFNESVIEEDSKVGENLLSTTQTLAYGTFNDGVYTGSATGYRDGLQVQIEIKDNSLISLVIITHNEINSRYYQKAMDAIPDEIITSQSISVDTVTGATFTSIGIMNATNDALSQALITGSLPETQSLPAQKGHGRS